MFDARSRCRFDAAHRRRGSGPPEECRCLRPNPQGKREGDDAHALAPAREGDRIVRPDLVAPALERVGQRGLARMRASAEHVHTARAPDSAPMKDLEAAKVQHHREDVALVGIVERSLGHVGVGAALDMPASSSELEAPDARQVQRPDSTGDANIAPDTAEHVTTDVPGWIMELGRLGIPPRQNQARKLDRPQPLVSSVRARVRCSVSGLEARRLAVWLSGVAEDRG